MTTVVYRDGILAADSAYTEESESGGSRTYQCKKLYELTLPEGRTTKYLYVGLAGDQNGLAFLRWLREGMDYANKPEFGKGADFSAIVVTCEGVYRSAAVFDTHCEPEPVVEPYHAIGSGAKCAFVALDMGATAMEAVERAAARDPYTRGPFMLLQCSG